jgi:hypothetical protein
LTSRGYIWTFPNQETTKKSVLVVEDIQLPETAEIHGVCGDYVYTWKKSFGNLF